MMLLLSELVKSHYVLKSVNEVILGTDIQVVSLHFALLCFKDTVAYIQTKL